MAKTERLGVWLKGVRVADFERRHRNEIRCRYSDEALERWPLNSPLISCSLPLTDKRIDARPFCRGLLPEGQALDAIARVANLPVSNTFGLLRRFGRDVAGALVISEQVPEPRAHGVEEYSDEALASAVEKVEEHPLGVHEDSELSLAGLQDKLLLVKLKDGKWGRPLRGCPSTHILKIDDPRHPGLVTAEAHCLELAAACGLTDVEAELVEIAGRPCLIVSRFDRVEDPGGIERVHQEDACQALGINFEAQRGRAKYERAGGPSVADIAGLLLDYAIAPDDELDRLARILAFTILIGNADAHGKNLAFLHRTPGCISLAPLYDTVPTMLWPNLRREPAMRIDGAVTLQGATLDHVVQEASSWPHPPDRTRAAAIDVAEKISAAIEARVIPEGSDVADLVSLQLERFL